MIDKVECVMLACDNCQEPYENGSGYAIFIDDQYLKSDASDDGWEMHHESGKHYCEKCHHYNDNDELVINTERTKSASEGNGA